MRCSFCGKRQDKVEKLVGGGVDYICNECVDIANEIIADRREYRPTSPSGTLVVERHGPKDTEAEDPLLCSFCGKSQAEVETLVAGPSVYICNECVDIGSLIIADNRKIDANSRVDSTD